MDKRTHTQSCDRDANCQEGLVCNGLDGCGYKHDTRINGETCNLWPECKSDKCEDNGNNEGIKVCIPSDEDRTPISEELRIKNNITGLKQSCSSDDHCPDGLICRNLIDGCGYKDNSRENGETCNYWPECKSRECKESNLGSGINVCWPSMYNETAISAELKKK